MSIETVVLDPASLLVNRKAKQRKTDRIDAKKMVRALLAHDRGDGAVLSRVRVPSVEEEDRKRLLRERRRLVKERTSLTNAIGGLLKLHGIFDLRPRARGVRGGFEARFADVETAYGLPFPPRARREVLGLPSGWLWSNGRSRISRPSATPLSAGAKPSRYRRYCRYRLPPRAATRRRRRGSRC